jgi:hypothetical protein
MWLRHINLLVAGDRWRRPARFANQQVVVSPCFPHWPESARTMMRSASRPHGSTIYTHRGHIYAGTVPMRIILPQGVTAQCNSKKRRQWHARCCHGRFRAGASSFLLVSRHLAPCRAVQLDQGIPETLSAWPRGAFCVAGAPQLGDVWHAQPAAGGSTQ